MGGLLLVPAVVPVLVVVRVPGSVKARLFLFPFWTGRVSGGGGWRAWRVGQVWFGGG